MAGKVQLNRRGMADLLKSAGVKDELHRRAERAAAAARASAPVGTGAGAGAYRDSITVEDRVHPSRAVSRVVADVPYALAVEAKTGNLARSLDAAGGA